MVKKRKTNRKGDLRIIDVGGRKARVGTTVSETLTSLVPAMFSLAMASTVMGIVTESLSKSGLNRKENQK